jgi:glycosyltransferase involved in cell wall biosynthesis
MPKPSLVILNSEQFGYNPATYYYCKYLRDRYDITYICWDHGLQKLEMNGVKLVYVSRQGSAARIFRIIRTVADHTRSPESIIFLKYFKGINTILRLMRWSNPFVLDIRTGSVEKVRIKRYFQDILLKLETKCFENITVISTSLTKRLHLDHKASILPLGADVLSDVDKKFDSLNLLYVGTLYNRNIEQAVGGFLDFSTDNPQAIQPIFTIIGEGPGDELAHLKKLVRNRDAESRVHILGRIPHDQLRYYFDTHNIGVSYIPMTDYYDVQPATKTFEYLLSGLAVIGTATSENLLVINETNGIMSGDSPDEFAKGLIRLVNCMQSFNSKQIRQDAEQFTWEKITDGLDGYLQSILQR